MSPRGTRKKTSTTTTGSRKRRPPASAPIEPATAGGTLTTHPSVVGIGASAGGLEALKAFFSAMPARTGLAFVVVVHLDPTHDSLLPELLARHTGLAVEQARDRQPLEADHVYIIPPNRTLTVDQGLLQVREVVDRRGLRGAIDHFFRSLAEDQRERAIAIVLSGTGTEGALGARAIKAEGGMVMAQAPETAAHPGMPSNTVATGLVDTVLAPGKMPAALLAYAAHRELRDAAPAPSPAAGNDMSAILGAAGEHEVRLPRVQERHLAPAHRAAHGILSMNEELQSANEELTTSKEELQSMNEELTTLNSQLQDKVNELSAVNDDLANLLVSTDIATVFVDTDFRIKRFTTAATQLLNLLPGDVGRPMNHLATNLIDVDLSRDARTVLNTLTPIEKEVAAHNGSQYLVRVVPYRTEDHKVQGVVLTLVNVTAVKQTERELRATREQLSNELHRMVRLHDVSAVLAESGDMATMLNEVLKAAVEVTEADMGDIQLLQTPADVLTIAAHHGFQQPFLDFFREVRTRTGSPCGEAFATHRRVVIEDVRTSPLLRGSESLAALATAGVQAVQSTPLLAPSGQFIGLLSTHFRAPHVFAESELKWLDLLAQQAAALIARRQTEALLANAHAELEQRVAERTKWLTLMHDITRAINDAPSWDQGLHKVLQRICETEHWQIGFVYLPDPDDPAVIAPAITCFGDPRFGPFHAASEHRRYRAGQTLPGRVYKDGLPVWVNGTEELAAVLPFRDETARQVGLQAAGALPVRFGPDVIAVLELFSDQPHPPNEVLEKLMHDVSAQIGKVLDRERSTAQMADFVWREQQGLLHTLHDSLGQTLTGLGMLSAGLRQQLTGTNQGAADTAQQVAKQAQAALEQVRQLSRGLFPVDVDSTGLLPALRELASTTEAFHKITVRVVGEMPDSIQDHRVATQIYRIAQEAVTNVVKHARATTISIELDENDSVATLRVRDDGIGIPDTVSASDGLGLRIMRSRATSIGAQFSVAAAPGGGTLVVCAVRKSPTMTESHAQS